MRNPLAAGGHVPGAADAEPPKGITIAPSVAITTRARMLRTTTTSRPEARATGSFDASPSVAGRQTLGASDGDRNPPAADLRELSVLRQALSLGPLVKTFTSGSGSREQGKAPRGPVMIRPPMEQASA